MATTVKRFRGLHQHRFQDNPEELRFSDAWADQQRGHTLDYLLDERKEQVGRPAEPSDRDRLVAATVVQWLGSPVGQAFLRDLGYSKK